MLSQLSYIPTCMCADAQKRIVGVLRPFVKKKAFRLQFSKVRSCRVVPLGRSP